MKVKCPRCGGSAQIEIRFIPNPVPDCYAIAGQQIKFTGQMLPVIECDGCGIDLIGWIDKDGKHACFPEVKP